MKNIDYAKSPLVKRFIELNSENKSKNHIFLFAGGGYGKTTAMKCLYLYLVNQAKTNNDIVPIYIDVKELNFRKSNPIINYIHSEYSGSDTTESDVENLFKKQAPSFSKKYTYYILIDGLNETNDSNKKSLIDDISDMNNNSSNINFVISSRVKEDFDRVGFNTFQLKGLDEDKIKKYLDKEFGERYNENTDVERINKSLIEILKIPMFMNVFSKTYNKKSPYPDIYTDRAVRKADILDSYIQKILKDLKERTNSSDNDILEFVINFYIPALAFQMQKNDNSFSLSEIQFNDLRDNESYFNSLLVPDEYMDSFVSKKYRIKSICTDNFALLSKSNGYSFVHQIWRDFFAAKHIINCMNAEKLDALEVFIDGNVRLFVGELIREYDNKYKYSKRHEYKQNHINGRIDYVYSPDTRKCECDFEKKNNLKTWPESPIEHFMQQHNMKSENPISPMATRNLVEIMKTSRTGKISAQYDSLDLKYINFYDYDLQGSSFNNTKIYEHNFILQGHKEQVTSVSYSPDGKKIVSGSVDSTIRIWDAETRIQIGEPLIGHTVCIESVSYSPDGKRIASGSWDNTIRIWDAETGKQLGKPLIGHTGIVKSVSYSSDGKKIVSGSWDKTIRIWDAETGKQIGNPLIGHTDDINSVSYSPDGKKIVSGSWDNTIRIWDAETGEQIGEPLIGHTDIVESVSYSPDGKKIVSGSSDKTIRIWDVETGKQIGEPMIGHTGGVRSVSFSPDGKKIVSGSNDKTIRIWDAETGNQIGESLIGHTSFINTVSYSPDGKNIVSGSWDKTIRVWDAETGKQIGEPMIGYTNDVYSVSYSPDGKRIVSDSWDNTIRIWDAETGNQIGKPLIGHTGSINSVSYSPDGKKIVSGSRDNTIRIWDAETGNQIGLPLIGHIFGVHSVSYSPNGKRIVSGSSDETIRIWDAETGNQIGESLIGHTSFINTVSYSPDGKNIVSGSWDKTIRVWDVETRMQIGEPLIGHTDSVTSVSYSPDGKRIVSGSYDKTIRIWDAETGKQIGKPLIGHTDGVTSVSYSPDGKRIVSGSYDKTIRIWDAETGKQIGKPLIGHTDDIESISYSPDGKNIVSVGKDGIRIWNLETHLCIVINGVILSNIQNCDFRNAIFICNDNLQTSSNNIQNSYYNDKMEFYRILYCNGADVPKESEPSPIPFEWNDEETNDKGAVKKQP